MPTDLDWENDVHRLTLTADLFDDPDLLPAADLVPRGTEPALARDLRTAPTAAERHRTVGRALEALGAQWLGYMQVGLVRGRPVPRRWFLPHAHGEWVRHNIGDRHHEVDPRLADAVVLRVPFVWEIGALARRVEAGPRPDHGRRFIAGLRANGIGSGVWLGVPGDTPDDYTVIGLDARSETSGWVNDVVIGQALVTALSVHEFLLQRLPAAGDPAAPQGLSVTQQGVLDGLLAGHSDKVIAHRLQLSSHAVDYHMRQLRRRFAARNRVQLVHAACALGTPAGAASHIW